MSLGSGPGCSGTHTSVKCPRHTSLRCSGWITEHSIMFWSWQTMTCSDIIFKVSAPVALCHLNTPTMRLGVRRNDRDSLAGFEYDLCPRPDMYLNIFTWCCVAASLPAIYWLNCVLLFFCNVSQIFTVFCVIYFHSKFIWSKLLGYTTYYAEHVLNPA